MEHVVPDERETVEVSEGVFLTQLAIGERMSIQHLRMEPGGEVPMHDHHHEQLGFVYEGTQTFLLEDDRTVAYAWVAEEWPEFPDYDKLEAAVRRLAE